MRVGRWLGWQAVTFISRRARTFVIGCITSKRVYKTVTIN